MSVLEKIKELDAQKAKLLDDAKAEALAAAEAAVATLNELGFPYRLVPGGAASTPRAPASTGTRRSGIRDDVLNVVKAHPNGISAADIRGELGVAEGDKKAYQSIANALANAKKSGQIILDNGLYQVAP